MRTTNPQAALTATRDGLAALAGLDPTSWSDEAIRATLPVLLTLVNQLTLVTSVVVGSFDARGLSDVDGLRTTRTWLTAFGRMTQGSATGWLTRARLLRHFPALSAAASQGFVPAESLRAIADLAGHVGPTAAADFDDVLAGLARHARPAEVAAACRRIHAHLDPDGAAPDPGASRARQALTVSRSGSLMMLRGQLDLDSGATLLTALDALMTPPAADDPRTPAQRRAEALGELAHRALTRGDLPLVQGERPHLGLLITPATLLGTATSAAPAQKQDPLSNAGIAPLAEQPWLNWVGEIPTALAQRLSCDAVVWRAVLDPHTGLPLEVGRTHRIVPVWIRRALHARDRGCRWPGCDAHVSWTDSHHLHAWYDGGVTNVDNLISVCRYHHRTVHEGRWGIRLDHATGLVHVTRPDGRPYELGPSRPWLTPGRQRGQTPPRGNPPPDSEPYREAA